MPAPQSSEFGGFDREQFTKNLDLLEPGNGPAGYLEGVAGMAEYPLTVFEELNARETYEPYGQKLRQAATIARRLGSGGASHPEAGFVLYLLGDLAGQLIEQPKYLRTLVAKERALTWVLDWIKRTEFGPTTL